MTKIAVLSRYKEDNHSWYNILKNRYDNIIVFNKFDGDNRLPNIGREGHTYLYYIINNYDNLADEILFSQYDPLDHFHRKNPSNHRDKHHISDFLNAQLYDFVCINPKDYDLFVRKRKIDWIKYYQILYKDIDLNKIVSTGACINGIFRVSRESILRHNISFYQKALDMLSSDKNPDEGFFFERAWKYIFTNYGNCPEKYSSFKNSIWLFGNVNPINVAKTRKDESYGHIKFYDDGLISSKNYSYYGHNNEHYWSINNDTLYVFSSTGSVTSTYKLCDDIENTKELSGDWYQGNKIHTGLLFLKKAMWQY